MLELRDLGGLVFRANAREDPVDPELLGDGVGDGLGVGEVMQFDNQYYAGGRQLSTDMLKDAYQHVMQDGRQLQARYLPQMQDTARGLNTAKILSMVRGGGI